MDQIPSLRAHRFAASQHIPCILWNPKVHYLVTSAQHLSLSSARSIQSVPTETTSWQSILILLFHLRLSFPNGLFPSGSSPKPCTYLSFPHSYYMPLPSHASRFDYPNKISWGVQTIMRSTDNYEEYRQLWGVQTIMRSTDNYEEYRQLWGVQTVMWSTDNYVEYRQLWGVQTIMWSTDNYVEYRQLWGVQTIMRSAHNYEKYRQLTFLLCSFLNSPGTSSLLGPNILLSTLFSNSLSLRSSHAIGDPVSHPYKTRGKIILLYILNFIFLDRKLEDQRLCAEWQQTFPEFSLFLIYSWMEILLFRLIPDIWTVPPVQRNYCQS